MPCQAPAKAAPTPTVGVYRILRQDDEAITARLYKVFHDSALNSINQSAFLTKKTRFEEARQQVNNIFWPELSWYTYGVEAPNYIARRQAAKILDVLETASLPPARLMASAEGGITMSFVEGKNRAEIEAYNTGEIAAATYSGQSAPTVWELTDEHSDLEQAVVQIRVRLTA
jgi:hypothetical protein